VSCMDALGLSQRLFFYQHHGLARFVSEDDILHACISI